MDACGWAPAAGQSQAVTTLGMPTRGQHFPTVYYRLQLLDSCAFKYLKSDGRQLTAHLPFKPIHLSVLCLYAEGADDDEPQALLSQSQCVLENPFDVQSTQLVLAVEQEARQRLLGHHAGPPAGSMSVSGPHAHDSSIKLQQAESMIQHLQRCDLTYSIAYLLAAAIPESVLPSAPGCHRFNSSQSTVCLYALSCYTLLLRAPLAV